MFEDSTFESMKRIHTRSRVWMIATFAFNAAILLALILIPLFYPEALTGKSMISLITAPPVPVEEPKPVVRPANPTAAPSEMSRESVVMPRQIPPGIYVPDQQEPPGNTNVWIAIGDGGGPGGPGGLPHGGGTSPIIVRAPRGPRTVSQGVMLGYLVRKVVPEYPAIGREIRLQGTVVLQATISKSGTIENLHVVSGPAMLQQAALDAVKQWQYKPYLLNGEPVEVETTVNVEFKLN
ncbi:MAG: energy transducer TonB [Terracidiphilus sp.]